MDANWKRNFALTVAAVTFVAGLMNATPASAQRIGVDQESAELLTEKNALAQLLKDARASKELEMTDDQLNEITQAQRRLIEAMMETRAQLRIRLEADRDVEQHNLAYTTATRKYLAALDVEMERILLPFQYKRLKQLALWSNINRNGGYAKMFASPSVKKELGISRAESAEIQEQAEELQSEFDSELAELRKKYRNKLRENLTSDQVKKLEELLGDESSIHSTKTNF